MKNYGIHNLSAMNVYNLVEYSVDIFLLYRFTSSNWFSKTLLVSVLIYYSVWIFTTFYVLDFNSYNNYIRMLQAVLMVFFSGTLLVQLGEEIHSSLFKDEKFWVATAWLIYFAVNASIYTLSGILLKKFDSSFAYAWMIKAIIDIFANILFSIAIICNYRKPKLS